MPVIGDDFVCIRNESKITRVRKTYPYAGYRSIHSSTKDKNVDNWYYILKDIRSDKVKDEFKKTVKVKHKDILRVNPFGGTLEGLYMEHDTCDKVGYVPYIFGPGTED